LTEKNSIKLPEMSKVPRYPDTYVIVLRTPTRQNRPTPPKIAGLTHELSSTYLKT